MSMRDKSDETFTCNAYLDYALCCISHKEITNFPFINNISAVWKQNMQYLWCVTLPVRAQVLLK